MPVVAGLLGSKSKGPVSCASVMMNPALSSPCTVSASAAPSPDGAADYDAWFSKPLNNAQLNSVAAYYNLVPGFERLLETNGGDLGKFYAAADKLAHEPKAERHQRLRALGGAAVGAAPAGSATRFASSSQGLR